MWYRLVVGGAQPTYVLQIARPDWASYDRFHRSVPELLAGQPAALADDVAAVKEIESETWTHRRALNYLP
ncbi:MAG TPA: hypothetical protein VIM98_12605 [Dyella sp.]|uniref:hypothetical protein n=1 Tax=Dyella sp. TaxID=1869338 RepID=UPI002F9421F9